jgi:hypothetical protein
VNNVWFLILLLADPTNLHSASNPPDSPQALLVKARTILEHLQTPSEPVKTRSPAPPSLRERAEMDLAAFVKPFFLDEGVAARDTASDNKIQ